MEQINWNEILQELEQLKEGIASVEASQSVEPPQQQEQVYIQEPTEENDYSYQWEYWMGIGRQMFISKYGSMPNFSKYLPIIEQRAQLNLMQDAQQNKMKNSYDLYLEDALRDVLKEFSAISQDFVSIARHVNITQQPQQTTPAYTNEDYYNDYKKMLEKTTLKDIAHIRFDDGSKHSGYWGQPKLELGVKPTIDI